MDYKIAIDMCFYGRVHYGGKDEASYNLLSGFEKIGVGSQIVCFAYREMVEKLASLFPSMKICVVPRLKPYEFIGPNVWFRSFYEERWAIRNHVKLLLLPNKPTVNRKFIIKTVEIPHDISVFEGILASCLSKRIIRKLKQAITRDFRNRDHIIAISDYDKHEMIKFFPWARDKIFRIYDPICFGNSVSNGPKKYIMALNIQWEHKNVETLIKAFSLIASRIEYDLILVGRYPDSIDSLKELVRENHLEDRVIFTGFVSYEELNRIIEKTRVYVNASIFEGFGMTAVEMMGRKVPTVVAANTAQPEVTMGLCRYYSPAKDHAALAETILEELKNPRSDAELESIAKAVRDKYSYEGIAKEYWEFFERALEESELLR